MKPFLGIGLPELVSHDDLKELVLQRNDTPFISLASAGESIARAKKLFETLSKLTAEESFSRGSHDHWVKNIKSCLRACISTGVLVASLKTRYQGKRIKVLIPEPRKRFHDWWVVPEVELVPPLTSKAS
jgi:hypothetical protein